jgi:hypothetical protein
MTLGDVELNRESGSTKLVENVPGCWTPVFLLEIQDKVDYQIGLPPRHKRSMIAHGEIVGRQGSILGTGLTRQGTEIPRQQPALSFGFYLSPLTSHLSPPPSKRYLCRHAHRPDHR